MGFFDFVQGAGEKLFGKGDDPAEAAKADPQTPAFDPAFVAAQLQRKVAALELPIEGLAVAFSEGVAGIDGTVPSRSVAEKAVLQLGNTTVVQRVEDRLVVAEPPPPPTPEALEAPEAAPAPPAPEPASVFYTVRRGDTLSKIAKAHYGTWKRYPEIFEANKPMLADPDLIYPGQVLRIPNA